MPGDRSRNSRGKTSGQWAGSILDSHTRSLLPRHSANARILQVFRVVNIVFSVFSRIYLTVRPTYTITLMWAGFIPFSARHCLGCSASQALQLNSANGCSDRFLPPRAASMGNNTRYGSLEGQVELILRSGGAESCRTAPSSDSLHVRTTPNSDCQSNDKRARFF